MPKRKELLGSESPPAASPPPKAGVSAGTGTGAGAGAGAEVVKRARGGRVLGAQNFSLEDRTALLNVVEAEQPLKPETWNAVVDRYNSTYAKVNGRRERDMASLKRQWFNMIGKPAADPACPEHIRRAKRIHLDISNRVDLHSIEDGKREDVTDEGNDALIEDRSPDEPEPEPEPEPDSDSRPFGDEPWPPQTPIPIRANLTPSTLALATTISVAGASADRSITRGSGGGGSRRRSQSHTAFSNKRSTAIAEEAEDLRAILMSSLDSKFQNHKEEARGIQTLLQLQIMNLQQELARKDDKVEKLQEKVRMLEMEATRLRNDKEREVGTIRNEKQLLEMRMMMMQMQQQQQQLQQQQQQPPPFAMGYRDHAESAYSGLQPPPPPMAFSGGHGNRFMNRWGNGIVDGTGIGTGIGIGNGVDNCGNGTSAASSGNGVVVVVATEGTTTTGAGNAAGAAGAGDTATSGTEGGNGGVIGASVVGAGVGVGSGDDAKAGGGVTTNPTITTTTGAGGGDGGGGGGGGGGT